MNPEERIGFLITAIAIIAIPFFFITAVLGSYREVQPEFLQNIPILDFLISTFSWDAVVLFFTSLLVYGSLIYLGWVGLCLYKGKLPEIKKQKRFIDLIYHPKKRQNEIDEAKERKERSIEFVDLEQEPEEKINDEKQNSLPFEQENSKYSKDFI